MKIHPQKNQLYLKKTKMTKEKFQEGAEAFQKTIGDSMKWFQETTKMAADTYSKQIEYASDLFNTSLKNGLGKLDQEIAGTAKSMMNELNEITRKNLESVSSLSKTTLDNFTKFGKEAETATFSKEKINQLFESYQKEAGKIGELNKKFADSCSKQFATTNTFTTDLTEKLKNEFEKNTASAKASFNSFKDTFSKEESTSAKTGLTFFNDLNKELSTLVNQNLKVWSDCMSKVNIDTKTVAPTNGSVKREKTSAN
jgi:hypothetical protein